MEHDCVYPDEFKAGYDATRELLQRVEGPVYFCDFTHGFGKKVTHFSTTDRLGGYKAAVEEAGREPLLLGEKSRIERKDRASFCAEWLSRIDTPVGVLASTASSALPLCHVAVTRGLEMGKDVSLLTFCNHRANDIGLEVSAMMVPMHEMGREAVELLVKKIESPCEKIEPVVLKHTFCKGDT